MPEKNWIDRYFERTPEEHAALRAAAKAAPRKVWAIVQECR